MYLWDLTTPKRDGDLSNDVITHEFTHGLTKRMTGGDTAASAPRKRVVWVKDGLTQSLSGQSKTDYALGAWVYNSPKGIRSVLYSTDMKLDPYTYGTVKTKHEVHVIGELWATMLIEVYAALVQKNGFSGDFFNSDEAEGNIVFLHLIVDALPLQPCSPTFVSARDAILLADQNRYQGANKCLIWNAFAKRGLGPKAANYVGDMSVPDGC